MSKYWDEVKRKRRERSAEVLRRLSEDGGRTLEEVGRDMGLTKQRIGVLAKQGRQDIHRKL